MKKSLYLLLVPAIALTLTACGGSGGQASVSPSPSPILLEPTPAISEAPSPNVSIDEKVFNTTVDEVVRVLAANTDGIAHVSIADVDPEIDEWEAQGSSVAGNYYSYTIQDGLAIAIIDSAQTGKVQSVSVTALVDSLSNDAAYDWGCYQVTLISMFEPDADRLAGIESDLNIQNTSFSDDDIYFASGSIAEYMYMISGGTSYLSIDPK